HGTAGIERRRHERPRENCGCSHTAARSYGGTLFRRCSRCVLRTRDACSQHHHTKIFHKALRASRFFLCSGCTNHAMPMLITYKTSMGEAKMIMLLTSGGASAPAMMKMMR